MSALRAGQAAARKSAAHNAYMIERLAKIAKQLARRAGAYGITVSDIRLAAYKANLLTGNERGRELSYLGAVPQFAGLWNSGRVRRSDLKVTHGIRQVVWVSPVVGYMQESTRSPYLD